MTMNPNEGFDNMYERWKGYAHNMLSDDALLQLDNGDDTVLLSVDDIAKMMGDGNDKLPTSQDLESPFVDYINNDSQTSAAFSLDQGPPDETAADSSQAVVDIGKNPIPYCGNIPANNNWPGPYELNIVFDPQLEKTTKSTTWTYSEPLDKLYVLTLKAVDIRFVLGSSPPSGCILRALPVFSKPEHSSEVVRRCPNHSAPTDATNEGHPAPDHIVRCESQHAVYQQCPVSGRMSVIVPYEAPQAGSTCSTYLYKFMCYSSCVGGLNRRPIQLIFTLEKNGEILGRRNLKVRICACPGRDRTTEEKRKFARSLSRQSSMTKGVPGEGNSAAPTKRKRNDDVYTVTIRGRENYELLSKVAAGLELLSETASSHSETSRGTEKHARLLNEALVRSLSTKGNNSLVRQPKIEKE